MESQIELIKLSFFTALVKIFSAVLSYGRTLLFLRVAVTQILNDIERYFINRSQFATLFLLFSISTFDMLHNSKIRSNGMNKYIRLLNLNIERYD